MMTGKYQRTNSGVKNLDSKQFAAFFAALIKKSDFSDSDKKKKTLAGTRRRISGADCEELGDNELMSAAGGTYNGEVKKDDIKRNN
jgi:hypothetical protein